MKKIKIEKEVTKEYVCVKAESVEDSREIRAILESAGEVVDDNAPYSPQNTYLMFDGIDNNWFYRWSISGYKITIPQLAELLGVEYPLKPEQLPTLEELIAEAKSKITVKSETFPCWVEGTWEIKTYHIEGMSYPTEKRAVAAYISKKIQEEYL